MTDQYVFSTLGDKYLVLINFEDKKKLEVADSLETAIRVTMSPKLNPVSKKLQDRREEMLSQKVRDYLK